jgi:3-oxoacyl-[acyl-carrier protein] reductase
METEVTSLHHKRVLVTGASRGIGRAIALHFAAAGADLLLVARDETDLAAVAAEVRAQGVACQVIPTDLRRPEAIAALAATALAGGAVDILVNNAGVGTWAPLEDLTLAAYEAMFDVNVRAVFLLTQALLPAMRTQGSGQIITIASTSSRWAYPEGSLYCASKFAVLGFSEALARELRPEGLRVTAILPGQVNTYLGGSGSETWEEDMLEPEDIAAMTVHVARLPAHVLVTEMVVWPRAEEF